MTTAVDVDVAKRIEVRAVFGYLAQGDADGHPYPLSIKAAQEHLRGIEDLLYLASVSEWNAKRSDALPWHERPADFVRQVYVRRISYDSPLEVVAWFLAGGTGMTVATTAANRLINVWANFQRARRTTAETELFITAANVLQATIDAPIPLDGPTITGYDRFTLAAQTLTMLSELEIQEEA